MCISSSCRRLDSPAGVEYKGTAAVGSELHHATKKSDESAFLDVKVSLWNVSNFYPTMVDPKFS